ncbi:MAG: type I polyketide synthase, partial [Spirochaetaceae bacterium]|nr:type I polyketide synthase [Spirochaetaceae bacterium]
MEDRQETQDLIAIIGMSFEFPGVKNPQEYWNILSNGIETIKDYSDEELIQEGIPEELVNNIHYVKRSGGLDTSKRFDADFFNYSPKESLFMDPQHRKFLEHSYKALEAAGIIKDLEKSRIGVFAGCGQNSYLLKNIELSGKKDSSSDFQRMIGNDKDFLATRVAYKLNLRGPAITVQTACSTSMTAIHTGIQNLLGFQCDAALCGAVSISVPLKQGYLYKPGEILSPDGHCRAFDKNGSGTTFGSGVGVVILKRLEDAVSDGDYIEAIIRGIALNNDGKNKIGYTAPGVDGQAEVIAMSHGIADVEPDQISYIEAHGTGTQLGDPIEIEALTQAFRLDTDKIGYCGIGSVKPNLGHLDTASGVAGLIKVILALKNKKLPPTINYSEPNPEMNIHNSPFYINDTIKDWSPINGRRIAGVSAFGVGGTNVHAIIEEWNRAAQNDPTPIFHGIIPFSGRTPEDRDRNGEALYKFLLELDSSEFGNASFSLFKKRKHYNYRGYYLFSKDKNGEINLTSSVSISKNIEKNNIVFCFPGQGVDIPASIKQLYETNASFFKFLNQCFLIIKESTGWDPLNIFLGENDEDKMKFLQTSYSQPILFSIEWAIAKTLMHDGIHPSAFIGHSLGELVAACLSGIFSLESAIKVVIKRGEFMQAAPAGVMLAVMAPLDKMHSILTPNVYISAINSENQIVVAGEQEHIEAFLKVLESENLLYVRLKNQFPFHTTLMDEAAIKFKEFLQEVDMEPAQIPFVSNSTGEWVNIGDIISPDYWADHIKKPVLFSSCVKKLMKDFTFFIEIGPGHTITGLIQKESQLKPVYCCEGMSEEHETYNWLDQVKGDLWLNGINLNYLKLLGIEGFNYIPTPTYQF